MVLDRLEYIIDPFLFDPLAKQIGHRAGEHAAPLGIIVSLPW